jgi:hypothetical protein
VTVTSVGPALADREVAAAVFAAHVSRVRVSEQARDHGWQFIELDQLHVVVTLSAVRSGGEQDIYHVKLGAEFYDSHPPTTSFVSPPRPDTPDEPARHGWAEAAATGSRWLPVVNSLPWFAIHPEYGYPPEVIANAGYRVPRQLVCCSMTLEYYISSHSPTDGQRWQQGRHNLGATLARIQDALTSPHYQGPSGAHDS